MSKTALAAKIISYLTEPECGRLVNACEAGFRNLVAGALLTGCRYSELATMQVADFNSDARIITIRTSKAGKPRHVVLTEEGQTLFSTLTAGSLATRAFLSVTMGARGVGSTLAMRRVPLGVIAEQLGHADTRMTEKHYAHLAPSYVYDPGAVPRPWALSAEPLSPHSNAEDSDRCG
jgi:integrase